MPSPTLCQNNRQRTRLQVSLQPCGPFHWRRALLVSRALADGPLLVLSPPLWPTAPCWKTAPPTWWQTLVTQHYESLRGQSWRWGVSPSWPFLNFVLSPWALALVSLFRGGTCRTWSWTGYAITDQKAGRGSWLPYGLLSALSLELISRPPRPTSSLSLPGHLLFHNWFKKKKNLLLLLIACCVFRFPEVHELLWNLRQVCIPAALLLFNSKFHPPFLGKKKKSRAESKKIYASWKEKSSPK